MNLHQMLEQSTWGRNLRPDEFGRVLSECRSRRVCARGAIVRTGDAAEGWMGLISGFGKMSVGTPDGRETTLTSIAAGGWFGEGTLIKHGALGIWQYDAVALRDCEVAMLPRATFEWLRATSLPFNHYLQNLMSARMGMFIARLSHDRLLDSTARVARCLASLFNPDLYPEPSAFLDLRQAEVGQLAGVSRQRANKALQVLAEAGLIGVERRGVSVQDLSGLRSYLSPR